jgi:hypothetical protein
MIVLDWEEFATLCPPGTIFSFLEDMREKGLHKKLETLYYELGLPSDFCYIDILPQEVSPEIQWSRPPDEEKYSLQIEPYDVHRWGEYDYKVKYIVYEQADVDAMIKFIVGESTCPSTTE